MVKLVEGRKEHERRLFRIVSMLHALGNGGSLKIPELAAEYSVSSRSIQRDIAVLAHVGFPLIRNERGRYCFLDGFRFALPNRREVVPQKVRRNQTDRAVKDFNALATKRKEAKDHGRLFQG